MATCLEFNSEWVIFVFVCCFSISRHFDSLIFKIVYHKGFSSPFYCYRAYFFSQPIALKVSSLYYLQSEHPILFYVILFESIFVTRLFFCHAPDYFPLLLTFNIYRFNFPSFHCICISSSWSHFAPNPLFLVMTFHIYRFIFPVYSPPLYFFSVVTIRT